MAVKLKRIILGVLFLVTALGASSIYNGNAYADNLSEDKPIRLQIGPVKRKLKLEPGQSYVSSIKVSNIGTEKFTYKVSAAPYSVIDEKYNADYESSVKDYTKMHNWVKIDENLETGTLDPKTSIEVPFTVTVPSDMHQGGQYATIMAETSDGNKNNTNIKTVNRLGMILYADITKGDIKVGGEIINNTVNSFILEPPLTVSSTVKNTGNFEGTATYTVKVWPLGSNETVFSNEDSPTELDIIPGTSRYNAITWDKAPHVGIFTVEQKIEYPNAPASVVRKLVIICPLWLMILITVIIVALVGWLVSRIIKRRKNSSQEGRA